MIEVELPNGNIIEFPDDTPQEVMLREIQSERANAEPISNDQIEAVAAGDLSATGYEPAPQFQQPITPLVPIGDNNLAALAEKYSDTGRWTTTGRRQRPANEAQPFVSSIGSFLASNFESNVEMALGDAGYAENIKSMKIRGDEEREELLDMERAIKAIREIDSTPLATAELSEKTGMPISSVIENWKEIDRLYQAANTEEERRGVLERARRDMPASWAFVRNNMAGGALLAGLNGDMEQLGFWETFLSGNLSQNASDSLAMGQLGNERVDLLVKKATQGGNLEPAEQQRLDQITRELSIEASRRSDESFGLGAFRSTFSTVFSQYGDIAYHALKGGAQAGAAAGIATAAFGPIAGVSAGSAFTAGAGAAAAKRSFEMSFAEIYGSLLELKDENGQGIDPDVAVFLSALSALPSAGLETFGIGKVLSLIPGVDKLLNRATVASAQRLIQSNPSLRKAIGKGVADTVGVLATEVGVETAQEGLVVLAEEAAKEITPDQPFRRATLEETGERLADAAYEALKAFALPVGVGGGILRVRSSVRDMRSIQSNMERLQEASQHSSTDAFIKETPAIAEKFISQLKADGAAIGDLYVNPEAMQRVLFQSDEGLQIARRIGVTPEDVADAMHMGTPVAVPMEKAVPYLLNTPQGKELLPDSTLDPSVMTPGEFQESTAGMTQEQLAQVQSLNDFFDFVDSAIEQTQRSREGFDRIAAPYVEQMRAAGYTETQARHYGDLLAAHAERFAPMFGKDPGAWLASRLQGIRLVDPNAPMQEAMDARAQRAVARLPLAERDPLLALVRGRLDGKSLSSAYNADTLKELTRAQGRGLFKSREKGGISIDELADEAVRRGLLPEGSGADELVERLKRKQLFQPANGLAESFADMPLIEADSSRWFGTGKPIDTDKKSLRKKLKEWAKENFPKGMSVSNADTGWNVQVTPKGIENSLSHGFDEPLARSVPFIPQIIESGLYLDSIEKKPGLMSHIFANKIRLDGRDYVVGFVLREDENGNRFYDHEMTEIINPGWLYRDPLSQKETLYTGPANRGDVMNILRDRLGVNDGTGRVLFQFIDPARVEATPGARDVVPVLRRIFHMKTMELDDSKATVTVPREEGMSGPLTDIYDHEALYELYPELRGVEYEIVPEDRLPGNLAAYSPASGTIFITTDPEVTPAVVAHEVQHAIQDVDERFDFGLSEEASQEVYSQVEQELKGKLPPERARALAARIQYLSQAHEIQAFDTQNRFELTAEERAKYEPNNPSTYYQNADNVRGKIGFAPDGKALITLFKGKKNLSTLIHESGHFFLENLKEAASLENAPEWVKKDWQAVKKAYGVSGEAIPEAAHEKFARQFEAYAREGKAPRPELQNAFAQFRAWLVAIYRSVRSLLGDEEMSADVRAVFDRLLATEEDIAASRQEGVPTPVIERAADVFGVPAERLDAYRQAVARGVEKGEAEIALRRMGEQKRVESDARAEARDLVRDSSFYRGMRELTGAGGIDWNSLVAMATEDLAWQMREKWNAARGRNVIKERGRLSLDDAAAYLGVQDGTEVLAALMNEPTALDFITTHVAAKVAEWEQTYAPDVEFINDAMDEALRMEIEALGGSAGPTARQVRSVVDARVGVKKADAVNAEYKALVAAVRKQKALIEEAVRDVRREERAAATERVKQERATATARVKNERANQRWSDASKNARIDELRARLAQLKQEERLKRAALGAAYRARIERDQKIRQIRRIADSKIPDAFKQQILSLVAHFPGLGTERMTPRPDENRPTLLQFEQGLAVNYTLEEKADGTEVFPIAPWLFEEAQRSGPRRASDLSLTELRDVYDAIKMLAHQGRVQDALVGMLHKQELAQAVAEATSPMAGLVEKRHITADERQTLLGKLKSGLRGLGAEMTVMRYLFDAADGYRADHDGPNSRLIVQPLQEAAAREQGLFFQYGTALRELLDPILGKDVNKTFQIEGVDMMPDVAREFGGQWTMERVLAVALNMGNDGNLAAIQRGYNWNEEALQRITRRLTGDQWRFVQKVWDLLDKLYPEINATYQQLYGVPLKRVEAKPFTVVSSDGETIVMRGGYYPLRFDKRFSEAAQRNSDFDALNSREDIQRTPNPRSGMTQERQGAGLPPLLSLSVLTSHVADAIHYSTHTLPLLDAYRIVKQPDYRRAMQRAFGDEAYEQIVPWLRSIAQPQREKLDTWNSVLDFMARRGSLAAMGFSLRTALLQFTSTPNSMSEVGTASFWRGAYRMIVSPVESWDTVRELSPYMASRARNMERDMADRLKPFREGTRLFGSRWEEAAFALIQATDAAVAYPTWMAKYSDAIAQGLDQAKAIRLADAAVIRAQGSGLTMDVTAMMRKPGGMRLITMFMSFAMNWQNRQRYYLSGYRQYLRGGQSEIGHARFFSHFALEWILPPVLELLLISSLRDGEFPEPEEWGEEIAGYWLMGIPLLREIPSMIQYNKSFGDSAAFSGANAAIKAGRSIAKIAGGDDSDEQWYKAMKNVINAVGFVGGVPTAPIWRTVEGTEAFLEGKAGPLAPILGAPPKDKQKSASTF